MPPRDPDRMLLYATSPVQRVVGHVRVVRVLADSPAALWEKCHSGAGIAPELFFSYFEGRPTAYALEVAEPMRLDIPLDLSFFPGLTAPQSYRYVDGMTYGRALAQGARSLPRAHPPPPKHADSGPEALG